MEVKLVVLEFVMMVVVMVVVMVLRPWGRAGSGIGQRKFQKARTSWRIALGITRAKVVVLRVVGLIVMVFAVVVLLVMVVMVVMVMMRRR